MKHRDKRMIEELLNAEEMQKIKMNEWEIPFLESLDKREKDLTERQSDVLQDIYFKYID